MTSHHLLMSFSSRKAENKNVAQDGMPPFIRGQRTSIPMKWNFFFLKQVDNIQLSAGNQWIYREMNSAFCWINCWPCKTEATEKPCQVWGSLNQSEVSSAKVFLTMVVWDSRTNGGGWGCWLNPTCGDAAQSGAHASSLLLRPRQSGTFPTELNPPSFIKSRFSSTLFGHHRSQCCVSNLSPHRLG